MAPVGASLVRQPPRIIAATVLGLMSSITCGCYLLESAQGQLALMSKREPIARVIENPSTPPALRSQLEEVWSIRDFASRELGLPDNGSYRSYADVGRPYVVWNVVAAPQFSVDAKEWCYPIVGCVAYRGYFVEARARSFAARARARGMDVAVGGVAAYSTLGHFNDPILNTMVSWNDVELAAIVFHELTHQMIYLPDDASFDEALATTVEEEGVRRWLVAQGREADLAEHVVQQEHYLQVIEMLRRTRTELRHLYASALDPGQMRQRKSAVFAALREAYARLKAQWSGRHAPFEGWFAGEINNAHLASVATYYDCVPGFQRELAAAGGDLNAFYRRVRELSKLDQRTRDAAVCGKPRE
jgi:predicted aminopeptidase